MKGNAADRLRHAGIALGVAAVLVLGPLAVGVIRGEGPGIDAAVVNMSNYPAIDDGALSADLTKAGAGDVQQMIVILPEQQTSGTFSCAAPTLPKSCEILKKAADRTTTVPPGTDPVGLLSDYGLENNVRSYGDRITTVHHDRGFGRRPALEVGLLMTIIAAGAVYFTVRSAGRRLSSRERGPVTPEPVHRSPGAEQHQAASTPMPPARTPVADRRPPPKPSRAPDSGPPPAPGPLPADVVRAVPIGRRVVARTHFGPAGGFVDIGGVVIWASLDQPGDQVHPGRQLSVVTVSTGSDALVVSSRITEEVRQ